MLPRAWYPDWATGLMDWYLESFGDPLCKHVPAWFRLLGASTWMQRSAVSIGQQKYVCIDMCV